MEIDPEQNVGEQRDLAVWHEIDAAQKDLLARRYWERFSFDDALQLIGFWAVAAALFLDMKLMTGTITDGLPPLRVLVILFFALLPTALATGWIVNFQMSLRTPRDRDRPIWLRGLRFLVACVVPLSPFVTPQLWKELLVHNPPWAAPRSRQPFHLDLRSTAENLPVRQLLEQLRGSRLVPFLVLAGTLWGCVGIGMLLRSEGRTADRITLAVSVLAHGLAFLCSGAMLKSMKDRGSRWSRVADLSRFLLLLPTPLSLLAFAPMLQSLALGRLLVDSAYSDLYQARRLLLWRGLEQDLRRKQEQLSWTSFLKLLESDAPRGEAGRVVAERAALFRLKTLFLIPEAGFLSWAASRHLGLFGTDDKTLVPLLIGAFALAFAGVLLQMVPPLARGLRRERAAELLAPYLNGGYLLLPAAAFLIGWAGGLMVAGHRFQELVLSLDATTRMGVLLLLVYGLLRFLDHRFDFGIMLVWGLLIPVLFNLVVRLAMRPEHAPLSLFIAAIASCLGLLAGIFQGGALLHPFSWAQLREPTISRRTRLALITLALTAILPLGGLAIPFWIWSRQRLWPWYQREILAEDK